MVACFRCVDVCGGGCVGLLLRVVGGGLLLVVPLSVVVFGSFLVRFLVLVLVQGREGHHYQLPFLWDFLFSFLFQEQAATTTNNKKKNHHH